MVLEAPRGGCRTLGAHPALQEAHPALQKALPAPGSVLPTGGRGQGAALGIQSCRSMSPLAEGEGWGQLQAGIKGVLPSMLSPQNFSDVS